MDNNKKKNNPNNRRDKNKKNAHGFFTLITWALVITLALQYLGNYINNEPAAASQHEIYYTEFVDLVEQGHVTEVSRENGVLYITPSAKE